MHYKNNKSDNSTSACQDALAVQGTWCLHSKGAVPGRGLNNNIIFRRNSNYQQLFSNLKIIFLIAVILLAIIRKLTSFAVSVQKKELGGSKSKSDWVSFSDAKVLHFNMADAHVCSCLLIWGGEIKGLLSGDN